MNLIDKRPFFLDGAMGANLFKAGMPRGVCPEEWMEQHPQIVLDILKSYIDAGSDAVYAPTFETTAPKLAKFGLEGRAREYNRMFVKLAKSVAGDKKVFGDVSPSGEFVLPAGSVTMEELVEIYALQMEAFAAEGADGAGMETQLCASDFRAAALAAKRCNLPFLISITIEKSGKTLTGCTLPCTMIIAESLGAFAAGLNCSGGPENMPPVIATARGLTNLPVIAKPNAGLPDPDGFHRMRPEEFAAFVKPLAQAGATVLGGCCGTKADHIRAMIEAARGLEFHAPQKNGEYICSESRYVSVNSNSVFSRPIMANDDIADNILDLDDSIIPVVEISTTGALECFIDAAPQISAPLCFLFHDPTIADRALLYYQGRAALCDDRWDLASKYGCHVCGNGS